MATEKALLSVLDSLMSTMKAKAKESELLVTDDMRLCVIFAQTAIRRFLKGNPRHMDEDDKATIRYLKKAGCNSNEISFAVNRSKGAVIAYLKELGE